MSSPNLLAPLNLIPDQALTQGWFQVEQGISLAG